VTSNSTKGQQELKKDISACQEEVKCEMSAIHAGQSKFEEMITDTLDRQSKGVMEVVQQQTQEFSRVQ
jgi:gas vesicle protein